MLVEFFSQQLLAPASEGAIHLDAEARVLEMRIIEAAFSDAFAAMRALDGSKGAVGVMSVLVALGGRLFASPFSKPARTRLEGTSRLVVVLVAQAERLLAADEFVSAKYF